MQKIVQLQLSPRDAADQAMVSAAARKALGLGATDALHVRITRRSIDARGRQIRVNLTVQAAVNDQLPAEPEQPPYPDVSRAARSCHIIGAGPAGLFAALGCIRRGVRPIIIERGKDVQARRRDIAAINRNEHVNPESNYCFGEGGAGTYSDGKLYTRSKKRGDIDGVLRTFVAHGASSEILVDAHPHIGTNKLPEVIRRMRETIIGHGGTVHFGTTVEDIILDRDRVTALAVRIDNTVHNMPVEQLILATGHSARDIYRMLARRKLAIEAKPFAIGVRVEHPQVLIDRIQYHCRTDSEAESIRAYLPAASYGLVHQSHTHPVYSFCMCPGGIIAPCATGPEQVVTNGWSPSKRNNPYANSGIVVALDERDFVPYAGEGPLCGLALQQAVERLAWEAGGRSQTAPAQRLADFVSGRVSRDLPACSYRPGIVSRSMDEVLGKSLAPPLREAFKAFGGKMRGYLTNDAVIVGVESRTSTPVRIPRDERLLHHPQIRNLYPCGEGAGYAGGIMSAAIDGERCAAALAL